MDLVSTQIQSQLANSRMDSETSALRRLTGSVSESGDVPESSLHKVSEDLESVFLRQLLQIMRESIPKSDLLKGGMAQDVYTSMLDTELAGAASHGGGIGLAPMVFQSLVESVRATGGEVVDSDGQPVEGPVILRPHVYPDLDETYKGEPETETQVDRKA